MSAPAITCAQISEEDRERMRFLERLDSGQVEVTDWEAGFIESLLSNVRPLTEPQRAAVDQMMQDYPDITK